MMRCAAFAQETEISCIFCLPGRNVARKDAEKSPQNDSQTQQLHQGQVTENAEDTDAEIDQQQCETEFIAAIAAGHNVLQPFFHRDIPRRAEIVPCKIQRLFTFFTPLSIAWAFGLCYDN